MNFIYEVFGYPLGYIMWALFMLVKNYGVAIVLFTFVTKLLLFPLSVKQQKNSAMMTAFQPKLQALQKKYGNNQEKLQEEQMKLYAQEGINPMSSCLPLLIMFPVLFGVIDVVYRPLTHIMHCSKDIVESLETVAFNVITAAQTSGASWATSITAAKSAETFSKSYQSQLFIIQAYNHDPDAFSAFPAFSEWAASFDMNLFGIFDLGANPEWTNISLLIPILAGLSQLLVTVYTQWHQKKTHPEISAQMGAMNVMLYVMPIVSIFIAKTFPMAVGFYWICQSIFSFFQQIVLNKVYTPEKVAELVKKDQEKRKKKGGKSYMERMMEKQAELLEQQKMLDEGNRKPRKIERDADGNLKLSKTQQKDFESKIIADARRRMEEKYKDDEVLEDTTDDND